MNIFYLHSSAPLCAQYHCDKHVVKMILEYAQLLSTAHHVAGSWCEPMYRPTHINHPCAVWVRANRDHYRWLYNLWSELLEEYKDRYGKVHKTAALTHVLSRQPELPIGPFEKPPIVVADDCIRPTVVESYRAYYRIHKRAIAKWKDRLEPSFMGETR